VRAVEVAKRLKEERPSFLKKSLAGREAKNFRSCGPWQPHRQRPQEGKFFWLLFFQKK